MPKDTIIGPKLNNLNFFMIGCWGENNCDERSGLRRVAEQMNKRYNIYQNYDFVISQKNYSVVIVSDVEQIL